MSRDADVKLLKGILDARSDPERTADETRAFGEMLALIESGERHVLSGKQRKWALEVAERLRPVRAADVPRGREVAPPAVLRPENLPKRPPPIPRPAASAAPPRRSVRHCGNTENGCYAFVNGDCGCDCCGGAA